jgi:hypothetical protein
MRLLFVGLLLLAATPSVALAQHENPNRSDWGEWARAFSTYASHPSGSTADSLRSAFLRSGQADTLGAPPPFDSLETWLAVLERQVVARDAAAVRLAFVLDYDRQFGSGDVGETLDIMLGKLLRIDPRLFLSALKAEEERTNVRAPLGGLVRNLGEEFVDRMQAQCRELHRRTLSVQGVRDTALVDVKHRVLTSLSAGAQERCSS